MALNIKIKRSGSGGGESGDGGIDKLTKVMKNFTGIFKKQSKLSLSGLGGGASSGLLRTLLTSLAAGGEGAIIAGAGGAAGAGAAGGAGGVAAGAAGAAGVTAGLGAVAAYLSLFNPQNPMLPNFEEVMIGTERKFLEFDRVTGDLVGVLSEEEAAQRNILDKQGKLDNHWTKYESEFDKMTQKLPKWKEAVILSAENQDLINVEGEKQLHIQRQITDATRRQLESMGVQASASRSSNPTSPMLPSVRQQEQTDSLTEVGLLPSGNFISDVINSQNTNSNFEVNR